MAAIASIIHISTVLYKYSPISLGYDGSQTFFFYRYFEQMLIFKHQLLLTYLLKLQFKFIELAPTIIIFYNDSKSVTSHNTEEKRK